MLTFWIVTIKQYYTHISEFISHITFSGSYYKITPHVFSEFIPNNIDTSRVTTKQYSTIILTLTFSDFFQWRCIRQYFVPSQMWTYCKSLLTRLSAKSTFRKVFGCLNNFLICLILPEYVGICLILSENTWICLNLPEWLLSPL